MAKAKKMSTGKKVGIGTAVVVAVGAILCYFFCPCYKKQEEGEEIGTDNYDFGAASTGEGGGGIPEDGGPAINPVLPRVPAPYTPADVTSVLKQQQGKGIIPLAVHPE